MDADASSFMEKVVHAAHKGAAEMLLVIRDHEDDAETMRSLIEVIVDATTQGSVSLSSKRTMWSSLVLCQRQCLNLKNLEPDFVSHVFRILSTSNDDIDAYVYRLAGMAFSFPPTSACAVEASMRRHDSVHDAPTLIKRTTSALVVPLFFGQSSTNISKDRLGGSNTNVKRQKRVADDTRARILLHNEPAGDDADDRLDVLRQRLKVDLETNEGATNPTVVVHNNKNARQQEEEEVTIAVQLQPEHMAKALQLANDISGFSAHATPAVVDALCRDIVALCAEIVLHDNSHASVDKLRVLGRTTHLATLPDEAIVVFCTYEP
jgi:hypothetical protein